MVKQHLPQSNRPKTRTTDSKYSNISRLEYLSLTKEEQGEMSRKDTGE